MLTWALFAGMTALAVLFVLVPLLRRRPETMPSVEAGEITVYRDQLAEIDRDLEAGLIAPPEADAARAEISRRILRLERHATAAAPIARSRLVPLVAAVLVPLLALPLYLRLGHPDLPDAPLATRKAEAPAGQSIEELVAKVEAHLAANPDDTKGWDVLAPTYTRLGRFEQAAAAWRNAIRTGGPSERRLNELGRVLVAIADDVVTPEARAAFEKSLEIEPKGILPRFFLASGLAQEGRKQEAVDAWKAIVAMGTGSEPWLADARQALAEAEADLSGKPVEAPVAAPAPTPGPSAADVEAAAQMSPEERAKMIETMVERLAERLGNSGGSVDEWERLVKAQKLIGRLGDARASLDRARAAFAGDAAALARLDALTTGLTP